MKYLSVCSGIEAATVAWEPLGWRAVAYSEIEKFPSAVLKHLYPGTPNWGDMTKYKEWLDANFSLLVGGTPCQAFSVAGLRKGLADPRGNLALVYLGIADRYRPKWVVWENVPGVLSSNGGRDFGAFLGALGELGYGWAYRVLDAQYFGVAQRRRRVFVVGHFGGWQAAHAVLFEPESMCGHPAPRRETGARVAGTLTSRASGGGGGPGAGTDEACSEYLQPVGIDGGQEVGHTLTASRTATGRLDPDGQTFVARVAPTLQHNGKAAGSATQQDAETGALVAHTLRGEGFDASEDGTGRGTPLVPVAFSAKDYGADATENLSPTLRAGGADRSHANSGNWMAVTTITCGDRGISVDQACGNMAVPHDMAVRRLTPIECERLQGFPDNYTQIPFGARKQIEAHELLYLRMTRPELTMEEARRMAADGPRYKALGNSMAVPVMRWIGERINQVEALKGDA